MRFCDPHWEALIEQVKKDDEVWAHVSDGGEEIAARVEKELQGAQGLETYDPMMAAHWGIVNHVVEGAGLAIMTMNGPEDNDKHWCPVCYVNEFCSCPRTGCGEELIPWSAQHAIDAYYQLKAERN